MKEQITLCRRCADDYRRAGIKIERDPDEMYMDKCDKCNRCGFVYLIERKANE
jgi:MinD superfamily P-loop ATPase